MIFVKPPENFMEEKPVCCTTNSICNGCFDDGCGCIDDVCTVCYV